MNGFIRGTLVVLSAAATAAATETIAAVNTPNFPNIIFVLMDDVGWSDFSYQNVSSRQYQPVEIPRNT